MGENGGRYVRALMAGTSSVLGHLDLGLNPGAPTLFNVSLNHLLPSASSVTQFCAKLAVEIYERMLRVHHV